MRCCVEMSAYECTEELSDKRVQESQSQGNDPNYHGDDQCGCLPECSETFYTIDVIQSKRRRGAFYSSQFDSFNFSRRLDEETQRMLAVLKVHFRDTSCLKYRREALMTWDALFATFGGIVGLCLGGSVLSLVELVYYATLRLWISAMEEKPGPASQVRVDREMQLRTPPKDNREDYLEMSKNKTKMSVATASKPDYYTRRNAY